MNKYIITPKQRLLLAGLLFTGQFPKIKGHAAMKTRLKFKQMFRLSILLDTLQKYKASFNGLRLNDEPKVLEIDDESCKTAKEVLETVELNDLDAEEMLNLLVSLENPVTLDVSESEPENYWTPIKQEKAADSDQITCPHCSNSFVPEV